MENKMQMYSNQVVDQFDDIYIDADQNVVQVITQKLPDLLKVLRDPTIFWESFSIDGVDERINNSAISFMFDAMEALESEDNQKLGALVRKHLLDNAQRIAELRA